MRFCTACGRFGPVVQVTWEDQGETAYCHDCDPHYDAAHAEGECECQQLHIDGGDGA